LFTVDSIVFMMPFFQHFIGVTTIERFFGHFVRITKTRNSKTGNRKKHKTSTKKIEKMGGGHPAPAFQGQRQCSSINSTHNVQN
jgi:hypothetical protein